MSRRRSSPLKRYLRQSRSLLYSYVCSLPLFLGYEVLIHVSEPHSRQAVRLSVDVWIQKLFSYFNYNTLSITLLVVVLAGVIILYQERNKLSTLKFRYFLLMGLEALIYAIGLALWLSVFVNLLLQVVAAGSVAHLPTMERIALSIGAGLYEELFFRLFLVSALIYLFQLFIYKKWIIYSAAIIIAAFIFSLMHYVGALGDAFSLRSFLFRFFFGVALSVIYWWRGFAVAAWTHSLYDILVVIYG